MTKKEQAFQILRAGGTSKDLMEKMGVASGTAATYKYEWKRLEGTATADDLADAIYGQDEEPTPKVSSKAPASSSEEQVPKHSEKQKLQVSSETIDPPIPKQPASELKVLSVVYAGEYGNYRLANKTVKVTFETAEMGLDKKTLGGLILELREVYKKI